MTCHFYEARENILVTRLDNVVVFRLDTSSPVLTIGDTVMMNEVTWSGPLVPILQWIGTQAFYQPFAEQMLVEMYRVMLCETGARITMENGEDWQIEVHGWMCDGEAIWCTDTDEIESTPDGRTWSPDLETKKYYLTQLQRDEVKSALLDKIITWLGLEDTCPICGQ